MSPDTNPRQYDCPTRFLVPSKSEQGTVHLVDLLAYDGKGECSCKWFNCYTRKQHEQGKPGITCRHIALARQSFGAWVTDCMRQHESLGNALTIIWQTRD